MPDLPAKKVGIVACSGEELAEGTVTRLAALRVLETLRPQTTVTICLPLFLAGGEGDRAFARFYPTIAIDGCDRRCAARATALYSGKPAASVVVGDVVVEAGLGPVVGRRRLNEAGLQAVAETAARVAAQVDALLAQTWSRRQGAFVATTDEGKPESATCACGSGIPVQTVAIAGDPVTLIALPALLAQFRDAGRPPTPTTIAELLAQVKIYNPVPAEAEAAYSSMLRREYARFWAETEPTE